MFNKVTVKVTLELTCLVREYQSMTTDDSLNTFV